MTPEDQECIHVHLVPKKNTKFSMYLSRSTYKEKNNEKENVKLFKLLT